MNTFSIDLVWNLFAMIVVLGTIMTVSTIMLIGTMAAVAPWIVLTLVSIMAWIYVPIA